MVMLAFEKAPSGRESGVLRAVRRCQSDGADNPLTAEEFCDECPEQLGPVAQLSRPGSNGSAAVEPVWLET